MDATPFTFKASHPVDDALASGEADPDGDTFARRWTILHEAAGVVAAMAGETPLAAGEVLAFPDRVRAAPPWRRLLAEQGLEDLAAVMAPGLDALIAIQANGRDAGVPARTLWAEFVVARDALVRLAAPRD